MTQSLIPNIYRYNSAKNFLNTFSSGGINGSFYYVFAGNSLDYENFTILPINDNTYETINNVYRNMIFGKIVQNSDVSLMIRNIEWKSGSIYAMYDDKDPSISSKDFFVYVLEGEFYNIFKCLDNNSSAALNLKDSNISTIIPSISSIGTDGIQYNPSDGYVWKYMYSVSNDIFNKFSTDKYIPFIANTSVTNIAVPGAIDTIKILGVGAGYSNYIINGTFSTTDVGVLSNSFYYAISTPGVSTQDDFYKGCILAITNGTGHGQYRTIVTYNGSEIGRPRYVQLNSPFTIEPDNSSIYSVYPGVYIQSEQTQTTNAVAWAYINPGSNTVSKIEMLNTGSGYKTATANVYAAEPVNVIAQATIRPILSPPDGHGAHQDQELYCSTAGISTKFANTEGNTVPSVNQFRQIGLLKNPMFNSASLYYNTINNSNRGNFTNGETVYNFYPKPIQNFVYISQDTNTAIVNTDVTVGTFNLSLTPNTRIYVSNGTNDGIFTVASLTNNSEIVLNETSNFDFSNATMYILDTQAYGTVTENPAGMITLSNISGLIKNDAIIVGNNSGGYSNGIIYTSINDENKNFNTFVQTYRYVGTQTSGNFINNETVTQVALNISNAVLFAVETFNAITSYYVTNQNGIFDTSNTIYGESSGAVATLTYKYLPELVFGSGEILYLENLASITRSNTQTETFKLVFEF
jgi:hypothetical protein